MEEKDGERCSVGPCAEEAHVAEGEVPRESVDDIDSLREGEKNHHVEEEELVVVCQREHGEKGGDEDNKPDVEQAAARDAVNAAEHRCKPMRGGLPFRVCRPA